MKLQKLTSLSIGLLIWTGGTLLMAQQAPDTILFNGKVVTMNEHGVNGNIGTTAQAIAVRGDRIVAVGNNAEIRGLAGPSTKSVDLKGRTVLPGMGVTHDHPMDWDPLNPYIVKKAVSDDAHIERFLQDPPDQQLQQFPRILEEAVQKAKSGQWIRISMLYGKEYRWGRQIQQMMGRQITKEMLDRAAPNNPVLVRAGFVGILLNKKAIETVNEHYAGVKGSNDPHWGLLDENVQRTGIGSVNYRGVEQDVLYPPNIYREIVRLGASWWAGYGLTANSSAIYTAGAMNAYSELDRTGQMDIRIPWSWIGPPSGLLHQPLFHGGNECHGRKGIGLLLDDWSVAGGHGDGLHIPGGHIPGGESPGADL